ncbi:hypothetical protein FSARC_14144 [Fusarium sarcochroum]|uniref:PARP-type domain-containing protein n=1 Tax=Fusarium sarcochroum TaxID=1208366 RepID=A0A8H4WR15_9HYPO|nr:hypothetical protein FSARC_14144 [Fusarium sarcochroum]
MGTLSGILMLVGISLCAAKPLSSQKSTATLTASPDFIANAIVPTASGQIGINPVDPKPMLTHYQSTASIGVDTQYLTELVQEGKTSTEWIGTATDFGLVTYTTKGYDSKPVETHMPRGFLVARHEDGQIEITLSKRIKSELNEIDELVPKCDDGDKDCLLKRPPEFLKHLVKRAVPMRSAHVLARDLGDASDIDVFSLVAGGGLIAFGASESVGVAASEAIAALATVGEVGVLLAAGGVAIGAMAVMAVLWGLGGGFSQEWKLKTDPLTFDFPEGELTIKCPEFPLACVGTRCKGGPGSLCTNEWPGCPCDSSSQASMDHFLWSFTGSQVQKAINDFTPGKAVEADAKCYAGEESEYTVDMDQDTWSDTLDRFCKTKPLLRNRFDETWTGSELGISGFDDWKFTFRLGVNEEDACEGYICDDVFDKFKPCTEDDAKTFDWGKLSIDCGTLSYEIDDGKTEDDSGGKETLTWHDQSCFASDEFGDHKDIIRDKVYSFAGFACLETEDQQMIKKDDSSTFVHWQRWESGAPYQFNIYWQDGCELENGKIEQWALDPLDEGTEEEVPGRLCEETLRSTYDDCNNGGKWIHLNGLGSCENIRFYAECSVVRQAHTARYVMGIFDIGSRLALQLRSGNDAQCPVPEAIASRAQPQLESGLVQLPSEIKHMIFQLLWEDAGTFQHLILRWGRVVGMACVTDVTGPDEVRDECAKLTRSSIDDHPVLWKRLASTWGVHWKCQELYESNLAIKSTGRRPFLPLLLSCRQLYVGARASIYENITFCIHDLDTLHSLKLYRPSLLLNNIQHLQLTLRLPLPNWREPKPSQGQKIAMARYRECCQALDQAENLASVYLWLDVVDPPARRELYTVPEGGMNPYVFGEALASRLTVDLPLNPDRPEAWEVVASVEPRFTIRPRGWPSLYRAASSPKIDNILQFQQPINVTQHFDLWARISLSDIIEGWLDTIITGSHQFQCTPLDPFSTQVYTPFDDSQTPTGPRVLPPVILPVHFPPPTTSSLSSASSVRSGSSSPVKRSTLELLVKPVRFVKRTAVKDQIPHDMLATCQRILVVSNTENFIPRAVREVIEAENEDTSRSWWYFDHPEEEDMLHIRELAAVREIIAAAEFCQESEAHETGWNVDIHAPLLKLALASFPSLSRQIITHAKISKAFVPVMQPESYYDITRSKMVDWAITVQPPPSTARRVAKAILSRPINERTINQTAYGPVRNNPIAISIETKIGKGTLDEARSQLGLWVAAWHQRMHLLAPNQKGRIITLPLMLVIENEWKLLFAYDRGDEIHIVEQIPIGSTGELKEVYRIIAVLRTLASWMETEFMDWLDRWLGGPGLMELS